MTQLLLSRGNSEQKKIELPRLPPQIFRRLILPESENQPRRQKWLRFIESINGFRLHLPGQNLQSEVPEGRLMSKQSFDLDVSILIYPFSPS